MVYRAGVTKNYPPEAYNQETGKLWWEITPEDGIRGAAGVKPRMASWLRWNVRPGERFTTRQLREALDSDHEHFQRRQRELRDWGWQYLSSKEEPELAEDCLLQQYGWWPGAGERPKTTAISAKTRRRVFERDGSRCVLCGRAAGELYEDGTVVQLTAGHIRPNSYGGPATIDNLRTECRVCNETSRSDTGSTADPDAVVENVRQLKKADRIQLLGWIRAGQRTRSQLDRAYDAYRLGGPKVQEAVLSYLEELDGRVL